MQVAVNRRMAQGLQFGASYTFSKSLGIAGADFDSMSPYFDMRSRNYGPLEFDRAHTFVVNYTYQIPSLGRMWNNKPLDAVLGYLLSILSCTQPTPKHIRTVALRGTESSRRRRPDGTP